MNDSSKVFICCLFSHWPHVNRSYNFICVQLTPANFFWDISVRFLSWQCREFGRRQDHFRRFPKKSENFRSLRTRINASRSQCFSLQKYEGIVVYSFHRWFSFLTWVWVNILLEIVSNKMATTHIFQSGVRSWRASVSRREIEVFNPQAWDSRQRRESWQVYQLCASHRDTCTRIEVEIFTSFYKLIS